MRFKFVWFPWKFNPTWKWQNNVYTEKIGFRIVDSLVDVSQIRSCGQQYTYIRTISDGLYASSKLFSCCSLCSERWCPTCHNLPCPDQVEASKSYIGYIFKSYIVITVISVISLKVISVISSKLISALGPCACFRKPLYLDMNVMWIFERFGFWYVHWPFNWHSRFDRKSTLILVEGRECFNL